MSSSISRPQASFLQSVLMSLMLPAALLISSGCATMPPEDVSSSAAFEATDIRLASESLVLREGDSIRVTFPGAPNLDTVRVIQRDGRVALPNVGDVAAAGKTPMELQKELVELYGPQLVVKEVLVSLENSAFPVFVTGAVKAPGKITSNRPLSVVEAIMESGGPDYTRANLKNVRVIRDNNGRMEHLRVNVRDYLEGKASQPFYLKPSDIIYVPERFSWL